LTCKTAELNEIIHELKLIDQVLTNVENGTEQIETVLKDVVNSTGQQDTKLLHAEATLDSAIQSAYRLYSIEDEYSASITPFVILFFSNQCNRPKKRYYWKKFAAF
jgi:ABC-type transporter Mla subunit MlaD